MAATDITRRSGRSIRERLGLRGRLAIMRWAVWLLARRGDPLARLLEPASLLGGTREVYPLYEQMRARGPVHRSASGSLVVTSHALCEQVLRDPRFRMRDRAGRPADADPLTADGDDPWSLSFLELDPPDHTRLRRLAAPAFRPKLIRGYRDRITTRTHELVDAALRRAQPHAGGPGWFDLIGEVAAPLPISVISDLLGVPDIETHRFARYGAAVGASLGGVFTARQAAELREAGDNLQALFVSLERARRAAPGDDVISLLTAAEIEGQLDLEELVTTCGLLLIAGFETTVNLLGNAVAALAERPEQWQALRADPARAAAVIEETLRYDPPVQLTTRVPHETIDLDGHEITPDTRVVLALAAAGRDPEAWDRPDQFDPDRAPARHGAEHLAFGSGIHYCLGAPLARLEGEVALQVLAERLPLLRPALHPAGPWRRRPGNAIRGFARAPLHAPTTASTATTTPRSSGTGARPAAEGPAR